jgi:tetratricopeptide (TPR) repeat protein
VNEREERLWFPARRPESPAEPTSLHYRLHLALHREEEGRYPEALALLDGVLSEDPDCLMARLHRGKVCVFTGQLEQAAAEFNAVLCRDEECLPARLHLAALFILMGLQGDAELHFRLAMLCSDPPDDREPNDNTAGPRRVTARVPFPRFSQN